MTPGLIKASRKANKLYNCWITKGKEDKNHTSYLKYKTYRNNYNSIKRKAEICIYIAKLTNVEITLRNSGKL